jgi:geranylgeranyl diphosphate synthase type I
MANPLDQLRIDALSEYGLPLGEAFQLRDDLLGVFGDASITGKPAGDDLREGKKTVLIALSRENQSPSQTQIFDKYFGSPNLDSEGITSLQQIILDSGAKDKLEKMIEELAEKSLGAIDSPYFSEEGQQLLRELAHIATKRSN